MSSKNAVETDFKAILAAEAGTENEPAEVRINDKNGDPYLDAEGKPAVFLVLGEYSDKIRDMDRRQANRILKTGRGRLDAGDLEEQRTEKMAAAVVGWRIAFGGVELKYSHENAIAMLSRAPWIARQVGEAMAAHASFFARKSSS